MLHKKIDLLISKISFTLGLIISLSIPAHATDITIESYITGGVSLALNGDYLNGINFDPISSPLGAVTTSWTADKNIDFIDFADDTSTSGFYITMSITDFSYTGDSQTQSALSIDNMAIIGKLNVTTPIAATRGYDDPDYNLSILPTSCNDATVDKFTLHSNFTDSNANYTLTPSNTPQTILTSTAPCLAIGHLRFDKTTLTYPANSAAGIYAATIVFAITDGTP